MKVFQVLECGGPGGTGEQVAALCNGLGGLAETTLVYQVRPGADAEAFVRQASGAKQAVRVEDFTREISPARDLRAFLFLYRLFKTERPDVVHAHASKAGVLARLAAKAAGVPKIFYSPRGYNFQMVDRSALQRWSYRQLERAVSWIGEIVAVSKSEAELAEPLAWGKPVHVVPDAYLGPAVEAGRFPTNSGGGTSSPEGSVGGRADRNLLIGACGRLTYARNPAAFVKLAQRVTDSRNGVKLVWIGDGELATEVREMIGDMNLANRLELTGWLERSEALKRLAGLDVFVHLSRWEGLPGAVLEAMAAGLPVVASDIPGNRDAIVNGETGFLAASEVDALERVLQLIDDPALRARLGAAGRRRVEQEFSLRKTLDELGRLYGLSNDLMRKRQS